MIRSEEFRYKMMRRGVEYGEIFASAAGTIRMSGSGEIKQSLQANFFPYAVDSRGNRTEINWISDEIKPYLVIDGQEHPLGVFLPAAVTPTTNKGQTTLSVEAYDRCWLVRDNRVDGRVYFAAGTKYITAIETLLASCGVASISITDTDSTFATDRDDWEPGTSYLSIVNALLKEISYKELWFDADGIAIIEPESIQTAKNIRHRFTDKKPDPRNEKEADMINALPVMSTTTDIYQKPNVIICICSSPDRSGDMKATAENQNPMSPLSIPRRGRRITEFVKVDNIPSQEALEEYTQHRMMENMTTGEIISIQTPLLPGFGVNDVCSVSFDDVAGVCIEREWDMQLTPGGSMSHKLERVVVNIG